MTGPNNHQVVPFPRSLEATRRRAARLHDQTQVPDSAPQADPPGWRVLGPVLLGALILALIGLAVVLVVAMPLWAAWWLFSTIAKQGKA